jgi:hypothetical protein
VIRERRTNEPRDCDLVQLGRLGFPEVVVQRVILHVIRGDAPLGLHKVFLRTVEGRLHFGGPPKGGEADFVEPASAEEVMIRIRESCSTTTEVVRRRLGKPRRGTGSWPGS